MHAELVGRIENIQQLARRVIPFESERLPKVKAKILEAINTLNQKSQIDEKRLEQELIFYAEKLDITEEKVRLNEHCDHFLKTMRDEGAGKKLGFITQEIGREINTLGSKAHHLDIQKLVVEMKNELEKNKRANLKCVVMSDNNFTEKAIIFSAPSGAGKTTIVKSLLANNLPLSFSISACSRQKRENEINGKDYHFLSIEDFKQKINEQAFIEWEEVYENNYYGTLKSEIERVWNDKKHVVFDVDVVGGLNLKKHFGNNALAIFIQPPSMDVLIERLRNRATESEASLNKRIDKAKHEMTYSPSFDSIIINDQLEETIEVAEKKVKDFLNL